MLLKSLDNGDFSTALQIQVQLTTGDWDECNFWLATLKQKIKSQQSKMNWSGKFHLELKLEFELRHFWFYVRAL